MTLNEFLQKAGQILGLAEKNLNAEQSLATVQAEIVTLKAQVATAETATGAVQAELTQAKADLVTAKASIASLTTAHEGTKAELKAANEKIANPAGAIQTAAATQAAQITASQGQPPLTATPPATLGEQKTASNLTGLDRVIAALKAEKQNK